MRRSLKRRIDRTDRTNEPPGLLEALRLVMAGHEPPETRAGRRAAELWAASASVEHPIARRLSCHLKATGKTLADLVVEHRRHRGEGSSVVQLDPPTSSRDTLPNSQRASLERR